jgi:hypothetical protein
MTISTKYIAIAVLTAIGLSFSQAAMAIQIFRGTGTNATIALEAMKTAIGGQNNRGTPGTQPNGFRTIAWDGVRLDGTDANPNTQVIDLNKTVAIPIDRFAAVGALYEDVYAVSGDGFASVNPATAGEIIAFSPRNTFAMFDFDSNSFEDRFIEQSFTVPGSTIKAATRGFGAIFNDVELAGSSSIEYFNGSQSLGKFDVDPSASGEAQFLGVLFDEAIVTDVTLTVGTNALFNFNGNTINSFGAEDLARGIDIAATDDFVFAEPTIVPEASTSWSTIFVVGLCLFSSMIYPRLAKN